MAKYSLWIVDDNCNCFLVPLSRDGQNYKEKVELYEIDLLTISLGKQNFIEALKNSHIAPIDFHWYSVKGYIEYQSNRKSIHMPLIFEKDKLFIDILNFYNKYCYYQGQTTTKIQKQLLEPTSSNDFQRIKSLLIVYRDKFLETVGQNPGILYNKNLTKELTSKVYRYMNAVTHDEQVEYRNDLLQKMFSYINYRRIKALEYDCRINQKLVDLQRTDLGGEEDEVDPDQYAFLTEDEKMEMQGYIKEKRI